MDIPARQVRHFRALEACSARIEEEVSRSGIFRPPAETTVFAWPLDVPT